jgi:hypothetical protein
MTEDQRLMYLMLQRQQAGDFSMNPSNAPYSPAPVPEGMITQSAPDNQAIANQQFGAQNSQIERQRDMAEQMALMAGKSPGLITAGNVSAAGASPMSALAQGLRGYQSGRQSRLADEGTARVREGEAAAAQAQGALDRQAAADEAAQQGLENQFKRDQLAQAQNIATQGDKNSLTRTREQITAKAAAAKLLREQSNSERDAIPMTDPSNPDDGSKNVRVGPDGQRAFDNNKPVPDYYVPTKDYQRDQRGIAQIDAAESRAQTAEDKVVAAGTKALSKDLEKAGLPGLDTAVAELQTYLSGLGEGENIPGVGGLSNAGFGIGDTLTFAGDVWDKIKNGDPNSSEGKKAKQLWQKVLNLVLKSESGSQVTMGEEDRQNLATGNSVFGDDEAMRRGLDSVNNVMKQRRANIYGGYSPEIRAAYEGNQGSTFDADQTDTIPVGGERLPEGGDQEGDTATDPVTGQEYVFRDGDWEEV